MNNMLTPEEVKSFLEITQDDLQKYAKQGKLPSYKIGGTYIRYRKEDVLNLRTELLPKRVKQSKPSLLSRLGDFWRFNNFYIVSLAVVAALLYFLIARA